MWPCYHDLLVLLSGVNFCEFIHVLWVTSGLQSKWLRDRRKPSMESMFCSVVLYIDGWIPGIWWQPEPTRSKEQWKGYIWAWYGQRGLCDTVTSIRRTEETEDQAKGSLRRMYMLIHDWRPQNQWLLPARGISIFKRAQMWCTTSNAAFTRILVCSGWKLLAFL